MRKIPLFFLFCSLFCSCIKNFDPEEYYKDDSIGSGGPVAVDARAVDLGLSVKWADRNVAAVTPEDYGGYYAWGETTMKSSYEVDNSLTYGKTLDQLRSEGIVDGNNNLTAGYDAATANWGSGWRMPTKAEQDELMADCTWTWTVQNGVNGYKVTSKKNGNSIFLPAAGYRYGGSLYYTSSYGDYWSATAYDGSGNAYGIYFGSGSVDRSSYYRNYGRSVRPVSER